MYLEDKLARLDSCLHSRSSQFCSNNQPDILKACYFQVHSMGSTIDRHSSIIAPLK